MHYVTSFVTITLLFFFSIQPINDSQINQKKLAQWNVSDTKINYKVKGRDIYIECIIPNFSFQSDERHQQSKNGAGHIHVLLNNKKFKEVRQAAFVLKDLPKGKHKITLKFMLNDNTAVHYEKSFYVHIE